MGEKRLAVFGEVEGVGWRYLTMLLRYTDAVTQAVAKDAHRRFSPRDSF